MLTEFEDCYVKLMIMPVYLVYMYLDMTDTTNCYNDNYILYTYTSIF